MLVEQLDQFGEVRERTDQPIDLIDDDHIDPPRLHIGEKLLQRRPVHRPARVAAVVVAIAGQSPALMRLTFDIGLRRLSLGVEGVEVLFESLVGRDPGVDRAAQTAFGRQIFHRGASSDDAPHPTIAATLTLLFRRSIARSTTTVFP